MASKKRPATPPSLSQRDPRVGALPDSTLRALAEVLESKPLPRANLGRLVGYLDHLEHAIYTEEEIAALFDRLVAAGVAEYVGDEWRFVGAGG